MLTRVDSAPSPSRAARTGSTAPCTSVLTMRLSATVSPICTLVCTLSSVGPACRSISSSRSYSCTHSRASRSFPATSNRSPASGRLGSPSISTGVDGPADSILSPLSSNMARILPLMPPMTMLSPTWRVPVCTISVATLPRLLSRRASTTTPSASRWGLACSSLTSDRTIRFSMRSGTPSPFSAETGTAITSPPHSSMSRSCSASWRLTLSWSELGRSTLLMAMTMGTCAARTWSIASMVWGMMPSSAATTRTAMSVAWAPRARMAVNASWPGVSRKVIGAPS